MVVGSRCACADLIVLITSWAEVVVRRVARASNICSLIVVHRGLAESLMIHSGYAVWSPLSVLAPNVRLDNASHCSP